MFSFDNKYTLTASFTWEKAGDCDSSLSCPDIFGSSSWKASKNCKFIINRPWSSRKVPDTDIHRGYTEENGEKSIAMSGSLKTSCGEASYSVYDWAPPGKNPAFFRPNRVQNPDQGVAMCPGYIPGGPARLKIDDIRKAVGATCKEWVKTNKGGPEVWTLMLSKTFTRKDWDFRTYDPQPGGLGDDFAVAEDDKIFLVKEWNALYCAKGQNGVNDINYGDIKEKDCVDSFMKGIDGCELPTTELLRRNEWHKYVAVMDLTDSGVNTGAPFNLDEFNPPKKDFVKWTGWSYNYCNKWIVTTLPPGCNSIRDEKCKGLSEGFE
jgi:hypothetical protein